MSDTVRRVWITQTIYDTEEIEDAGSNPDAIITHALIQWGEYQAMLAQHAGSQRALAKVIAENTAKQAVVDAARAIVAAEDVLAAMDDNDQVDYAEYGDAFDVLIAAQQALSEKARALDGKP